MIKAGRDSSPVDYSKIEPTRITTLPDFLAEFLNNFLLPEAVNYDLNFNYLRFLLRDSRPFS